MLSVNQICSPSWSSHGGILRERGTAWKYQPAKGNFSLNFCETRKYAVYYGTYYSMKK